VTLSAVAALLQAGLASVLAAGISLGSLAFIAAGR
jgi:hypothetical protein